jgi:hypothetical protein
MLKPSFLAASLICFTTTAFADTPATSSEACPNGKKHYRASVRHIESSGIGYNQGYTTLEAFLAPDPGQWSVVPFLDGRGHVFDNGKWAANAGVGLRTLWGNRAYGINAYYDYRNTERLHYNQVGVGLESLGKFLDFRINGYLPVGKKITAPYHSRFGRFSGHYMLVSNKYQYALKGIDTEIGFHFGKSRVFDFYAAAGPYYYRGRLGDNVWGGKGRLAGMFKDYLTLEISNSYDSFFHNHFQGQISFTWPFGPKSHVNKRGRITSCDMADSLISRMVQPVGRQEIIPVGSKRKNSVATNPTTGAPLFFVFVDNTSHSNGTYESPYPTLLLAQENSGPGDIIYVFPGNGTPDGMDAGITLQANQKFWGSGVSHLVQTSNGTILIPVQSSSSPTIQNTNHPETDGNAITLATNNAISGFTITAASNVAIYGADPQSLSVSSCTIENVATFVIEASFSGDASVSVTNNQFLNNTNGISLTLNGTSTVVCLNNTFTGQTSTSECPVEIGAHNNILTAYIENNVFDHNTTGTLKFMLTNVANANLIVLNNTFTNNTIGAEGTGIGSNVVILNSAHSATDHCSITLSGNTFSGNESNALYLHTDGAFTTLEATLSDNTMSNNGGSALALGTPVDTLTLVITDNIITGTLDNAIGIGSGALISTGTITINNNTFTDIGDRSHLASGIAIARAFSTLNLTILNNEINRCAGTGILYYDDTGVASLTMNVSGNTISNCQNGSSNAASGFDIEQYTNLVGSVTNNTFSDNVDPAVVIGSGLSAPTTCLTLTGNTSSIGYQLNAGDGVFNLSPCNVDSVNVGTITRSGTIFPVQSCPAATPCP